MAAFAKSWRREPGDTMRAPSLGKTAPGVDAASPVGEPHPGKKGDKPGRGS